MASSQVSLAMTERVTTRQPLPGNWITPEPCAPGVPPGLEFLAGLDTIMAHQQIEWVEGGVFDKFETNNRFVIKDTSGGHVFYSVDDSGCCARYWCGPLRPFGMKVVDRMNNTVIHLQRPFRCDSCYHPPCFQQTMEVSAPPGTKVGSIHQVWNFLWPKLRIDDAAGETHFFIKGPFWVNGCCSDPEFKILDKGCLQEVGKITKDWSSLAKDAFKAENNHFGVTFPQDIDPALKAVMLGALFLIDFMYYETSENDNY